MAAALPTRLALAFTLWAVSHQTVNAQQLTPMPDYFQKSWQESVDKPLRRLDLPGNRVRAAPSASTPAPKLRAESMPVVAAAPLLRRADFSDLPPAILGDVPVPPVRPAIPTGAIAFAQPEWNVRQPEPAGVVPQPVARPRDIDTALRAGAMIASPPAAKPGVQVAALGPVSGTAIVTLARFEPMSPFGVGGCAVSAPVKLVALGPKSRTVISPNATLTSAMVGGLVRWEAMVQAAARRNFGESITAIHVAASYACRNRNNRRRGRLSEHATGNALDVSGYITSGGQNITVRRDFRGGGAKMAFLQDVHKATCEVFQVVLGPGSDGYHEDHFHMDMGRTKLCR